MTRPTTAHLIERRDTLVGRALRSRKATTARLKAYQEESPLSSNPRQSWLRPLLAVGAVAIAARFSGGVLRLGRQVIQGVVLGYMVAVVERFAAKTLQHSRREI